MLCYRSLIVGTKIGYKFYSLKSPQKLEKIYENCENYFTVTMFIKFSYVCDYFETNFRTRTRILDFRIGQVQIIYTNCFLV